MAYADDKLTEEENRAKKYLDFTKPDSNETVQFCGTISYEEALANRKMRQSFGD